MELGLSADEEIELDLSAAIKTLEDRKQLEDADRDFARNLQDKYYAMQQKKEEDKKETRERTSTGHKRKSPFDLVGPEKNTASAAKDENIAQTVDPAEKSKASYGVVENVEDGSASDSQLSPILPERKVENIGEEMKKVEEVNHGKKPEIIEIDSDDGDSVLYAVCGKSDDKSFDGTKSTSPGASTSKIEGMRNVDKCRSSESDGGNSIHLVNVVPITNKCQSLSEESSQSTSLSDKNNAKGKKTHPMKNTTPCTSNPAKAIKVPQAFDRRKTQQRRIVPDYLVASSSSSSSQKSRCHQGRSKSFNSVIVDDIPATKPAQNCECELPPSPKENGVSMLIEMGFDREEAYSAYRDANCDLAVATSMLLSSKTAQKRF